jgi:hypothetical protein
LPNLQLWRSAAPRGHATLLGNDSSKARAIVCNRRAAPGCRQFARLIITIKFVRVMMGDSREETTGIALHKMCADACS